MDVQFLATAVTREGKVVQLTPVVSEHGRLITAVIPIAQLTVPRFETLLLESNLTTAKAWATAKR